MSAKKQRGIHHAALTAFLKDIVIAGTKRKRTVPRTLTRRPIKLSTVHTLHQKAPFSSATDIWSINPIIVLHTAIATPVGTAYTLRYAQQKWLVIQNLFPL